MNRTVLRIVGLGLVLAGGFWHVKAQSPHEPLAFDSVQPLVIRGTQGFTKSWHLVPGMRIDAREANWLGNTQGWAIQIVAPKVPGVQLIGGEVAGPLKLDKVNDWHRFHGSAGVYLAGLPKVTVQGMRIGQVGDGIRIREDCPDWIIRDCYLFGTGDDAIENDNLQSGLIDNCLIERTHVGISLRPSQKDALRVDGSQHTLTLRNTLIRLAPQRATYKNRGAPAGHGGFFKAWTKPISAGRRIQLRIINCIFCASQQPYTNTLSLDPAFTVVEAQGNTLVWLGEGVFPERVPPGWTETRDPAVWDRAVTRWKQAHGIPPGQ